MNSHTITFIQEETSITVAAKTTLLAAEIAAGLQPDAPCGGQGTCGKCLVRILDGTYAGIQKACALLIDEDMTVDTSLKSTGYTLLSNGSTRTVSIAPMLQSLNIAVEKCKVGESISDWDRLKSAVAATAHLPVEEIPANPALASTLYEVLRQQEQVCNVLLCNKEIIALRPADSPFYLVAFDIGTTSLVGYLLDGKTGKELAVCSSLNPQSQFGADVIMRANYALEHHLSDLSHVIQQAMNQIIETLTQKLSITKEEIYQIAFVGNTCMHHLFLGISPDSLVHSPYNPALSEALVLSAAAYGLTIHPAGKLMVLPNIAGFVGADTVGCLLSTNFDKRSAMTLMIDIGTNGELVLGNKDHMVTCSTAAGPAFEGAKIACGMRGSIGAIEHLRFESDKLIYQTIGNAKPAGLCGSGLMDVVAILLQYGFLEDSGRILMPDECKSSTAAANANRIQMLDKMPIFILAFPEETVHGKSVYISQKDIREVQLAKAAIAAGISLMCEYLRIQVNDIEEVLIAGAFGNYMSPASACAIGLIPPILLPRITPIGNAAGEGSKIALLNQGEFEHASKLAKEIEFLELAAIPAFQDAFVDELEFPIPSCNTLS